MKRKSLFAVIAGTALEFYDITLYGFFAASIAPLFFPSNDDRISLLASLGTFAAGFIMRPLGGIFFGHVGDRYGRKKSLILAICLVTIPTFLIGILPSYSTIGFISPVTLIICRLLQGLCVGGEYSGAAVFINEHTHQNKAGFAGGVLCASAFLGAVIGSIVGALCTISQMPNWGWRLPFLLGGFFGLIALLYRRNIEESASFLEATQKDRTSVFPLAEVIKKNKLSLLCTFMIGSSVQIPFYVSSLYMNLILKQKIGLSTSEMLALNTMIMTIWMLLLPLAGYLADRWNSFFLMRFSLISIIVISYPLFFLIEHDPSLSTVLLSQCLISFFGVWYMGVSPSLMPKLFPIQQRVSGMGISFSLGQALLSGTSPLIISSLLILIGDEKAPAYYLISTSLLGLIATVIAKRILKSSSPERLT